MSFPRWNRSAPARALRRVLLPGVLLALRWSMRLTVEGREHLAGLDGPVLLAANHLSHMDTPAIYQALPGTRRYRVAPAMAREFFSDWFGLTPAPWHRRAVSGAAFILASECFNAFPLPQRQSPRAAFRYMRELVDDGYSILIYPEGKRVDPGEIAPFQRGVGVLAADLEIPVVPVRIDGLDYVFPRKARIPRRGPVRIAFGAPLTVDGETSEVFTQRLERAIRAL